MGDETEPKVEISPEETVKKLQGVVDDLTQRAETLSELPVIQTEIDSLVAQGAGELDPTKRLYLFKKALELAERKVEKVRSLTQKS
jgi:hypothetical protein